MTESEPIMRLTLIREMPRYGATLSRLFNGSDFICDVLEDEVRELPGVPVAKWKIPGKTAIPAGAYKVEARHSPRFGPQTLTLLDVPGYEFIRIHAGNTDEDTEGCLLVGVRAGKNTITLSRATLLRVKDLILPALRAGRTVILEILNPEGGT